MAEAAAKATSGPQLEAKDFQPLVPLRVDVSLAGNNTASPSTPSLRIVETILLDPFVWPLRPTKLNDETGWIEDNVRFLAHNVLTDLEVQGMGRTVRHFTNRAEIWSVELQKRVMNQLRPQLKCVAAMRKNYYRKRKAAPCRIISEPPTKQSRVSEMNKEADKTILKKEDLEKEKELLSTSSPAEATSSSPANTGNTPAKEEESKSKDDSAENDPNSFSHLIPIKIRLSVHGIRIQDDCLWDPSLSSKVTPIDYAKSLANDLKLSPEAVQAIAVDITEQLYGSTRDPNLPEDVQIVDEGNPSKPNTRTTAAWSLDSRTHISHVAHLVAQHRQP
eukprot:scaffold41925_cov206-Amphora_coffeaeformis.AAC.1